MVPTPDREYIRSDFRTALAVHLPYAVVSALVVLLAIPVGSLVFERNVSLSGLPFSPLASIILPQERSTLTILSSDAELFSVLVIGAATLGLLTLAGLAIQGLVTGYFVATSVGQFSTGYLFVALVPHGLPKLLGFVLAGAVSFRVVACGVGWLAGTRGRFLDTQEWRQTGIVLACGACSLLVSALIEAHLTVQLTELLF